jgi:hypothetical protein
MYKEKYIKYKTKYLDLKSQIGAGAGELPVVTAPSVPTDPIAPTDPTDPIAPIAPSVSITPYVTDKPPYLKDDKYNFIKWDISKNTLNISYVLLECSLLITSDESTKNWMGQVSTKDTVKFTYKYKEKTETILLNGEYDPISKLPLIKCFELLILIKSTSNIELFNKNISTILSNSKEQCKDRIDKIIFIYNEDENYLKIEEHGEPYLSNGILLDFVNKIIFHYYQTNFSTERMRGHIELINEQTSGNDLPKDLRGSNFAYFQKELKGSHHNSGRNQVKLLNIGIWVLNLLKLKDGAFEVIFQEDIKLMREVKEENEWSVSDHNKFHYVKKDDSSSNQKQQLREKTKANIDIILRLLKIYSANLKHHLYYDINNQIFYATSKSSEFSLVATESKYLKY